MFIAFSYLPASAPEERNVTENRHIAPTERGSLTDTLVYKHLAPPEQRQVS
jgi:hypothetical protein